MSDLSDTAPVKEGDLLAGKFRVQRLLGQGGMGVVVAAMHEQLGKRVALKFMLPAALANATAVQRFLREARSAVQLRGEHVAQVLDVGTMENGSPYMVMEYLEGHDLGSLIEQHGALPVDDCVDYVIQACEAIAEAHSLGIVHRDLKPRNLFLTQRVDHTPLVKVLDFGISKVMSPGTGNDHSLTRTSDVMGSPNYMAPEQIRGAKGVDQRTDIWALGVILYELLSGTVPFLAETLPQLCGLVLESTPRPLSELRRDVHPGVCDVVAKCMEKDPLNRFQSIAEMVIALEPFAPQRSRVSAERVRGLTGSLRVMPAPVHSSEAPVGPPQPSGGTSVAWGETMPTTSTRRRALVLVVGIAGVAGLVALGVGAAFGRFTAKQNVPTTVVSVMPLAPTAPPAPPAATSAAPEPSAAPSASTSAPGAPLVATAKTTTARPAQKPSASPPAPASAPKPADVRPAAPKPEDSLMPGDRK